MAGGCARRYRDRAKGLLTIGSNNTVFCNNAPVATRGTKVKPHGRKKHKRAKMREASSTVFIGGVPVCRRGDKATCGHKTTGSSNVYIGS